MLDRKQYRLTGNNVGSSVGCVVPGGFPIRVVPPIMKRASPGSPKNTSESGVARATFISGDAEKSSGRALRKWQEVIVNRELMLLSDHWGQAGST